jgi:hypothetical protein
MLQYVKDKHGDLDILIHSVGGETDFLEDFSISKFYIEDEVKKVVYLS